MNLDTLFNPKSIAVVGASADEGTVGNVIAKNVLNLGYAGKIFLVNPKHSEVLGQKCYPSLFEINDKVDLAIVAIPAKFVATEIKKNAKKIKNYVIISAGFSEIGEEGKKRELEIKDIADKEELNILGPNCLGFIVPKLKLNASFAGGLPKDGNIAFITQSGALAVGMMDMAEKEDICFSKIISIGNKMDIGETEIMDYLSEDEGTKAIGIYLEGIKNGQKFMKIARGVSRIKPIVILKSGKTEKSKKAIASHTGVLAGSDEIISAVFEKSGIIRADNLEEFFSILKLISQTKPPLTEFSSVVTNAGGPGVLITDSFQNKSIKLNETDEEAKSRLRAFLPQESSVDNPIDILGDAHEDRYEKTLKILDKDKNIGSIILILTPQDQTPVDKIAKKIVSFRRKTQKNISTVFIGGKRVERAIKKMRQNEIPNFPYPEKAVDALNKYYQWSVQKNKNLDVMGSIDINRQKKIAEIIQRAKGEGRRALSFSESREIMQMYGVESVDFWEYSEDMDYNRLRFPVVVKIDSDKVIHKTDKKGVVLGIKNKEELKNIFKYFQNSFKGEKIIIQPMLPIQTELIVGIKKDPLFGPILIYGLGGIYTEIFKQVDFLVPFSREKEIRETLLSGGLKFLFYSTRGQNPYSVDSLSKIIYGVQLFAVENSQIEGLDINPLLIYNNGEKSVAVDIKIII